MRKNLLQLAFFLALAPAVYLLADHWLAPRPPESPLSQEARDFELQGFRLSSLKGRPLVLHFWATWCGPCVQELPELLRLARARKDLEFVALAEDRDEQALEGFFRAHPELAGIRADVRVLLDAEGAVAELYHSNQFPESFLVDRNFRIDNRLIGPQRWTYSETAPLLQRLTR